MFARFTKIAQLLLSLCCIAAWSYVLSEDGLTQLNAESKAPVEITPDAVNQTSQSSRQLRSDDISISDRKTNVDDILQRTDIKSDGDEASKRNNVRITRSEIFRAFDEEDQRLGKKIELSFYDNFDTLLREEVPVVSWRFSRMKTYDNSKSKGQFEKISLTSFVDDPAFSPSELRDAEEEPSVAFRRKRFSSIIRNLTAQILKELNNYGIMRFNEQKESSDPTTVSPTASGTHSKSSDSSTVSPTVSDTRTKFPTLDIWMKKVLKAFDEYGIKYFFEPTANDTHNQSRSKRESEEIDLTSFIDDFLSPDSKIRDALAKEKPSVTFRWKRSLGSTFDNWTASVLRAFDTYGIMYFFPPSNPSIKSPTANIAKSRSKRIRRVMNSHSDPSTVYQRSRPIRSLLGNYNKTVENNNTSGNAVDSPPKT